MKKIFTTANIILFCIALVIALLGALVAIQLGGDKLSAVLTSVAAGIVGTMIIGGLASVCKWDIGSSPAAGAIGALIGMIAVYFFL